MCIRRAYLFFLSFTLSLFLVVSGLECSAPVKWENQNNINTELENKVTQRHTFACFCRILHSKVQAFPFMYLLKPINSMVMCPQFRLKSRTTELSEHQNNNVFCFNRSENEVEFLSAIYWFAYKWFEAQTLFSFFLSFFWIVWIDLFVCLLRIVAILSNNMKWMSIYNLHVVHEKGISMNDMRQPFRLGLNTKMVFLIGQINATALNPVWAKRLPILSVVFCHKSYK